MSRRANRALFVVLLAVSCDGGEGDPRLPDADMNTAGAAIVEAFPSLPGFTRPVDLQFLPDGSGRAVVLEQGGRIFIFDTTPASASPELFLDLSGEARSYADGAGEETGLLGLAFHPDFAKNGRFYVDFTAQRVTGSGLRTVVARFTMDPTDPGRADPKSRVDVLAVEQPYSNHNGGQLAFGPDGFLYVGLGDGGNGGDPQGNGQSLATLLGAILRIDVDGGQPYAVPPTNPFVGRPGARAEIWANGLRNPWRFSFDPATEALWAGDVGQDAWEEIDVIEKGKNYGWNVMEGAHCFDPASGCDRSGLELPVAEYDHGQGQSVTGGHVYRGAQVPELFGKYIYADFASGTIWTHEPGGGASAVLARTGKQIASFGVDPAGELYLCAFDGRIYTIR